MRLRKGLTITVIRPAERDDEGDRIGPDTEFSVKFCGIAYQASRVGEAGVLEENDRQETSKIRGNLFAPNSADVRSTDKIRLPNGQEYFILGYPQWDQDHPMNGWNPGYRVFRIEGVF